MEIYFNSALIKLHSENVLLMKGATFLQRIKKDEYIYIHKALKFNF